MSLDEPPPKDPVAPAPVSPTRPVLPATHVSGKTPTIYSVPRRFDLAMLFVVSFAFALMFGACRFFEMRAEVVLVLSGYFALIGVSQAVLFQGKRPRLASLVAGGLINVSLNTSLQPVFLLGSPYRTSLSYSLWPSLEEYLAIWPAASSAPSSCWPNSADTPSIAFEIPIARINLAPACPATGQNEHSAIVPGKTNYAKNATHVTPMNFCTNARRLDDDNSAELHDHRCQQMRHDESLGISQSPSRCLLDRAQGTDVFQPGSTQFERNRMVR